MSYLAKKAGSCIHGIQEVHLTTTMKNSKVVTAVIYHFGIFLKKPQWFLSHLYDTLIKSIYLA